MMFPISAASDGPAVVNADLCGSVPTCGMGPVPHLEVHDAVLFAAESTTMATLPTLPRWSPLETTTRQGLVGIEGVSAASYGTLMVDVNRLDPEAAVETDLDAPGFVGFGALLEHLVHSEYRGPIKWQLAGPITVSRALERGGADRSVALSVATSAVRQRVESIGRHIDRILPHTTQIILLDETPVEPRPAGDDETENADALSTSMAAGQEWGHVGVQGAENTTMVLESGPMVLGVNGDQVERWTGRIARFVNDGGVLMIGCVRATGPVLAERIDNRELHRTVATLTAAGVDPEQLVRSAILTTDGALAAHDVGTAATIHRRVNDCAETFAKWATVSP